MNLNQQISQRLSELPPAKQQEVLDFVEFLARKAGSPHHSTDDVKGGRKPGSGKGQLLWMAGDFDSTPEGFEEYT